MEIINTATTISTTIITMETMGIIIMEISIIAIIINPEMKMVEVIGREVVHGKDREVRKGKAEVTMGMAKIKAGREGDSMEITTTIIGEMIQEDRIKIKIKDGRIINNKIGIKINITTGTINKKKGLKGKTNIIKMNQEIKYLTVLLGLITTQTIHMLPRTNHNSMEISNITEGPTTIIIMVWVREITSIKTETITLIKIGIIRIPIAVSLIMGHLVMLIVTQVTKIEITIIGTIIGLAKIEIISIIETIIKMMREETKNLISTTIDFKTSIPDKITKDKNIVSQLLLLSFKFWAP